MIDRATASTRTGPRSGSALIMVLALAAALALLVAEFGAEMRTEMSAASTDVDEAMNYQLARSAVALARMELGRKGTQLYADGRGDAFFVPKQEDYETAIEELQAYRRGWPLGSGMLSYRFIVKPNAIDPNKLSQNDWHRLLDVACGIEEGEERNALVDSFEDWIDADNLERASGAEEESYQRLDPPRHAKNAPLDSYEELLLVQGFTPEMLFGYNNPVRVEDGMLAGGGLLRWFIGDNSPEARASVRYIVDGVMPSEDNVDEEMEVEYRPVQSLPAQIYLVAQGFVPVPQTNDDVAVDADEATEPPMLSRHIVLLRLQLSKQDNKYKIAELRDDIGAELLDRVLAYGVPADDGESTN